MKYFLIAVLLLSGLSPTFGQTYADSIANFRKKYISELLEDKSAPIKESQVKNLSFFPPDESFRTVATFHATPGMKPFMIQTHSAKKKPYRQYGILVFKLNDITFMLNVFQSINLLNDPKFKDHLFLPFNDLSNYVTTYGGGRYLDLSIKDINSDGTVLLDFNKCYNPYCAYAEGFSCPIPPKSNRLAIEVNAGEKTFVN